MAVSAKESVQPALTDRTLLATTSQHQKVLEQPGLVTVDRRGREHVSRLEAHRLRSVACAWLDRFA